MRVGLGLTSWHNMNQGSPKKRDESSSDGSVRVQKFLADQGVCSRRHAEEMIAFGEVLINGQPAVLGQKVLPGVDRVNVRGKFVTLKNPVKIVLLVNKPRGLICSNDDPHNPRTVFEVLPPVWRKLRLFCVGRLDKESEGLLVLTNDGALAHRLAHPSSGVVKRYRVVLSKPFDRTHVKNMKAGIQVDGEILKADEVIWFDKGAGADHRVEIHLHQGRKREIRRMMERLGYFVDRLERIQIGGLTIKGLGPGSVRQLTPKEIRLLSAGAVTSKEGDNFENLSFADGPSVPFEDAD